MTRRRARFDLASACHSAFMDLSQPLGICNDEYPNGSISAPTGRAAISAPWLTSGRYGISTFPAAQPPQPPLRGIASGHRIQEKAYGALPTNIRKMLVEAGAKHSKIRPLRVAVREPC